MKTNPRLRILLVLFALILGLFAANAARVSYGSRTILPASIAEPSALSTTNFFVRTITVLGKKAPRTDNAGSVYLGVQIDDDTQSFEIQPGQQLVIKAARPDDYLDLMLFYVDITVADDGVIVFYQ